VSSHDDIDCDETGSGLAIAATSTTEDEQLTWSRPRFTIGHQNAREE